MKDIKFFGESCRCLPEEIEEAKAYLISWKKFLLRKFSFNGFHAVVIDEQWHERDAMYDGCMNQMMTISLKMSLKGIWDYELR